MDALAVRCNEAGAKSIKMVGLEFEKHEPKLPEKWDLADPLPQGLSLERGRSMVATTGTALVPDSVFNDYTHIVNFMKRNGYEPYMLENFKEFFNQTLQRAIDSFKIIQPNLSDAITWKEDSMIQTSKASV